MNFCDLDCSEKACVLINAFMEGAIGSRTIEWEIDDERVKYSAPSYEHMITSMEAILAECPDVEQAAQLEAIINKPKYGPAKGVCFAPSKGCGYGGC